MPWGINKESGEPCFSLGSCRPKCLGVESQITLKNGIQIEKQKIDVK